MAGQLWADELYGKVGTEAQRRLFGQEVAQNFCKVGFEVGLNFLKHVAHDKERTKNGYYITRWNEYRPEFGSPPCHRGELGQMDDDDRSRLPQFAAEYQLDDLPPQSKITLRFSEIEPHDIDPPAEKGLPRKRPEWPGG